MPLFGHLSVHLTHLMAISNSTDTKPARTTTPTIEIYVKLAQYPILSDQIRLQMRQEIFSRGVMNQIDFEFEVKNLALESQIREGLNDPYSQEDENTWQKRLASVRDIHTDNLFANNIGVARLDQLIQDVLQHQGGVNQGIDLTFNPEIAPWALLFHQGRVYEALPPPKQTSVNHHLEELKVVLIKRLISDQLKFIGLAKKVFAIEDLHWIYERLAGAGKIGGKAAGMLLAWKILEKSSLQSGVDIRKQVAAPESYFIGSESVYEFLALNNFNRFNNQKYLDEATQHLKYKEIVSTFTKGQLPDHLVAHLRELMQRIGKRPFIVRSSSLLEDNLSHTFSGMYESIICTNQASEKENFKKLLDAIRKIFACTFNPAAIKTRKRHKLLDYDERMAIIIQPLIGENYGRYYFPAVMGYGLSRPTHHKQQSDGILHLVLGFHNHLQNKEEHETKYCIPLKNPKLREAVTEYLPGRSPQNHVTVIDTTSNSLREVPLYDILSTDYPRLPQVASTVSKEKFDSISKKSKGPYALTFLGLTEDPKFVRLMRTTLSRLEEAYRMPVKIEFTVELIQTNSGLAYKLHILQCHPQR
ncbi:MAG: PEP/pyruvate-binding domain-containing protein [Chloroflexota bacterium]